MTDTFLTPDELFDATGAKLPEKQRQILDTNGIRYICRADGKIRTTWTAVNHSLIGSTTRSADNGFNLGALNATRKTARSAK